MFTQIALAEGTQAASSMSPALTTALTDIAKSCTDTLSGVIPIAVPVVGIGLAVVLGIKLFKRITGKA